jgi:predicted dehydrogenase
MASKKRKSGIRVGVIGLGMGKHHVRHFLASPDVEAVYVCDLVPERMQAMVEEHGLATPTCADYGELLADDSIDALSVCLPNRLHAPVAIDALRAGKHVMCEKPMATTVAEARRMVREARKADRILMMHFNQRFSPEAQLLKRLLDAGELGDVYLATCHWIRRRGIPGRKTFYTKETSGGGALIDIGVHILDLALWYMGHPEPAAVTGCTYCNFGPGLDRDFDVDDHAHAFVRFANGASLSLETSWASHVPGEAIGFELRGTKGGARRVGSYQGAYTLYQTRGGGFVDLTLREPFPPSPSAQARFAASILHGEPNAAPGEHGLAAQVVLEALYKSAAKGREVRIRSH